MIFVIILLILITIFCFSSYIRFQLMESEIKEYQDAYYKAVAEYFRKNGP